MGRSVYPLCDRAGRDGTSQGEAARYIWPKQSTDGGPRCRGRRLTPCAQRGSGRSCSPKGRDWCNRSNGSLPLGRRCDAIAPPWCVCQRTPREAAAGVGGAGTPRSRSPGAGPVVAGASRIPTSPPPCTRGLSKTGLWPGWCDRHPPWSGPITWRGFPGVGDDNGDSRANSTRETRRRCAWWHRSRRRCSGCPRCGTRPGSVHAGAVGLTGLPLTSTTAWPRGSGWCLDASLARVRRR